MFDDNINELPEYSNYPDDNPYLTTLIIILLLLGVSVLTFDQP